MKNQYNYRNDNNNNNRTGTSETNKRNENNKNKIYEKNNFEKNSSLNVAARAVLGDSKAFEK